jgi:hypothetical protein
MKYFTTIDLGWALGTLYGQFEEAKKVATLLDCKVTFEFQHIKVCITKLSNFDTIYNNHRKAMNHGVLSCFGEGW